MKPFEVPEELLDLKGQYPDALFLTQVAVKTNHFGRKAIARQWLSEGIPFAFKDCPVLFECVREWIAGIIGIDPKDIWLTGSAKLGQSIAPHKLGRSFSSESDLDLFIISEKIFNKLSDEFNSFSNNFNNGIDIPSNYNEAKFWPENIKVTSNNIRQGFVDSSKIPNYAKYRTACLLNDTNYKLVKKLASTKNAPLVKRASARCYENWDSFVRQKSLNLRSK